MSESVGEVKPVGRAAGKKMTSVEARELLESLRGERDGWIVHTLCVGECAGKLAVAAGLDEDLAKTLAYLHDIGRGVGPHESHIVNGYKYLKDLGLDEQYCNICLTHSFQTNEPVMISGDEVKDELVQDFIRTHEFTPYEEIVGLSDLLCTDKVVSLEKRLIDVMLRYGTSEATQARLKGIYELKARVEKMMGKSVEEVIDKTD